MDPISGLAATDLPTMLINLTKTYPSLVRLITASAFVMGLAMAFRTLYLLRQYGELRMMMSTQTDLRSVLILALCSCALLYLPSMFGAMTASVFGSANPLAYYSGTTNSWMLLQNAIVDLVQLIGVISFIRGWVIISHLSGGHAQQGTLGKGLVHLFAGIFAVHLQATAAMLQSTLGISL